MRSTSRARNKRFRRCPVCSVKYARLNKLGNAVIRGGIGNAELKIAGQRLPLRSLSRGYTEASHKPGNRRLRARDSPS